MIELLIIFLTTIAVIWAGFLFEISLITFPSKYIAGEIIKSFAEIHFLCVKLREGRVLQTDINKGFYKLLLLFRGHRYAHEAKESNLRWENKKDKIPWKKTADKWAIKEDPEFDLALDGEMSEFQKWCLRELNIYWFSSNLFKAFQIKVRESPIEIYTIDADGNLQLLKESSPYLFAKYFDYGFKVENAEDETGVKINMTFSVRGRCVNPYVANILNERWDLQMMQSARDRALKVINKYRFVSIVTKEDKDGNVKVVHDKRADEIIDVFKNEIYEELTSADNGFEWDRNNINVISIDLVNKELVESFDGIGISENKKISSMKGTDAKVYEIQREGEERNKIFEETIRIASQNPKSFEHLMAKEAVIGQAEQLKNSKSLVSLSIGTNGQNAAIPIIDVTPRTPSPKKKSEAPESEEIKEEVKKAS